MRNEQEIIALTSVECINQHKVPIIMLTEAIRDYIQQTSIECKLMAAILTIVLTLYVEIVLHKKDAEVCSVASNKNPSRDLVFAPV
uniref:Uncharacterized protein n=1 Tax=Lactuca sativa TaxID=4236 RepID=A0A9R1X5H1_LACSA|nr:hypothetical protein LSAT_V11C600305070 [Lactuca sativa]